MSLKEQIEQELSGKFVQGGESWLKAREGKITASEVSAIMGNGTREMTKEELDARPKSGVGSKTKTIEDATVLSDAAITYLCAVAWEITSGQRIESAETYAMKRGSIAPLSLCPFCLFFGLVILKRPNELH